MRPEDLGDGWWRRRFDQYRAVGLSEAAAMDELRHDARRADAQMKIFGTSEAVARASLEARPPRRSSVKESVDDSLTEQLDRLEALIAATPDWALRRPKASPSRARSISTAHPPRPVSEYPWDALR
jgi:hypothetical protein